MGVIVLNKFSKCGSCLASGMGYHCLLWQPEEEALRQVRKHCSQFQWHGEQGGGKQSEEQEEKTRECDKAKKLNEHINVSKRKRKLYIVV